MKSRFYLLAILTVSSTGILAAQEAEAQERRGARFDFAPNYFRVEQPRTPKAASAPSLVSQGAMPRSSDFLGLDKGMLASRPAPLPTVAAVPAMPSVSSKAFVPNTAFHPSFGQPILPLQAGAPLQMAQLPVQANGLPSAAAPNAARTVASPAHTSRKSAPAQHHATKAVTGKLRTPASSSGASAAPATYGSNFGYVPGEHLPAIQIGSGTNTHAEVHGRIIRH